MKISYEGPSPTKLVLERREAEVLQFFANFRDGVVRIVLEGHAPVVLKMEEALPGFRTEVCVALEQALRHQAQEFSAALEEARRAALPPSVLTRAKEWFLG